jgi:AcrR family transcriptional regulator
MTKKEILIQQTEELIMNKGYYQTGVNELLEITKVSKGSLYYHFPEGKEHIFSLALENIINNELTRLKNFCSGKALPALNRIISHYSNPESAKAYPFIFSHLANELRNEKEQVIFKQLIDFQEKFLKTIANFLKDHNLANPKRKSRQFYMLLLGYIQMREVFEDEKYDVALDEILERIF